MKKVTLLVLLVTLLLLPMALFAGGQEESTTASGTMEISPKQSEAIEKWIKELQPSQLSDEEMREELEWFARVGSAYKGVSIKSVGEGL